MAIAFRSVGAVKKATTGNLTSVGLPTGHATDDILECHVVAADNATGSMPAGWVQKLAVNNGTRCRYELWWKRDNGAETAPTVTRTGTKVASMAWITAHSGVDNGLSDPYRDAQTQTGTGTALGNFTITCPALTGVVAGDMGVLNPMYGVQDTDGAVSITAPGGSWTQRLATQNQVLGVDAVAGRNDDQLSASGGSVGVTASWNGSFAPAWVGVQAALSSASSGGAAEDPYPYLGGGYYPTEG